MNNKLSIRKDLPIEILMYAQQHVEFTEWQLMDDLHMNQVEKNLWCTYLRNGESLLSGTNRAIKIPSGEAHLWTLSVDGRFKLLAYEQAQSTRRLSWIAIGVAIFTGFIQIAVGVFQIFRH